MTSLKTSIKTITYLSDTGCLEIQGASLITYDCGDTSKIKNSLQMRIDGTTGVVDQYNLVARRRSSDNVPDVGIRIENLGGGVANIPFQNGILPVDPSGHGTVNMRAWPVNLVGGELETGKFQGTATITVIVR
ncbi:fimbrial-like adhesin protein [Escherichia coli]|nr:fimbrial-like adhesin protein [Escherichia coli]